MPINTNVSNLPSAPNRSGSPNTFTSDTDAFLAALPTLQSEINAYAAAANSTGDQINEYLLAAEQGAVTGLDIARWDSEVTYARFDPVIGSDGNTYRSLVDNNLGNDPTADSLSDWLNLTEIELPLILKPELLSPTDGATDIGETPTLDAGNYYSLYGRPHTLSRFQVATDQAFTSIVYDSGEIAATQTHTVPAGNLQEGQVTYYWRAYYEDDAGNQSEFSDAFEFVTSDSFGLTATGGTVTDITDGGVNYRVHTFTSSGTFQVTSGAGDVEYLVVAGGGGGGDYGGGGAGGYRSSVSGENSGGGGSAESALSLTAGSYAVTIGAGGAGGTSDSQQGGNSDFSSITSIGGGRGGANDSGVTGGDGGSGGGRGTVSHQTGPGGSGTVGQGFDGGGLTAVSSPYDGAGGGGASQVGGDGDGDGLGGDGGDGVSSNITGSAVIRAGGGAGGSFNGTGGTGGAGGGGDGGSGGSGDTAGQANTGGGGGAPSSTGNDGSNGGSGIVIIRYPI